jgi:hypothetical protein
VSWVRAHPDDPVAGVTLASELDLDPERPQDRLGAPQPAGQRPRVVGPPSRFDRNPRQPSKVTICNMRSNSVALPAQAPRAATSSRTAVASGSADGEPAVRRIGAREGAGGPQGGFAYRRPERKVGHPRQPLGLKVWQGAQSMPDGIEQRAEGVRMGDLKGAP